MNRTERRAAAETLEDRRLLAFTAAIENRGLVVAGDAGENDVKLVYQFLQGTDGQPSGAIARFDVRDVTVLPGTTVASFAPGDFDSIRVDLGDGDDLCTVVAGLVTGGGFAATFNLDFFRVEQFSSFPIRIDLGAGDDSATGSPFAETIVGGDGDDRISTGGGSDSVGGDAGADVLLVDDDVFTEQGNYETKRTGFVVPTLAGGDGDDEIRWTEPAVTYGTVAEHVACYMTGGSGDDTITGSDNGDTITGGAGRNRLFGGAGNDRLNGSGGRDFLYGGDGDDRLYGNGGNDNLDGGGGKDRIYGGDGDDLLIGGGSIDRLYGDAGSDTLIGGKGNDYLFGGDGVDHAPSRDADDVLDSIEG